MPSWAVMATKHASGYVIGRLYCPVSLQCGRRSLAVHGSGRSACGILPQDMGHDTAFEFQQDKQPAAIPPHDALFCSHDYPCLCYWIYFCIVGLWGCRLLQPVKSNYRLLTGEAGMWCQEHNGLPRMANPLVLRQDAESPAPALQRANFNTACLRRTGCENLYPHCLLYIEQIQ